MRAHDEGALGQDADDPSGALQLGLDGVDSEIGDGGLGHLDDVGARRQAAAARARVRGGALQPGGQRVERVRVPQVHKAERRQNQPVPVARDLDGLERVTERRQTRRPILRVRQVGALPEEIRAVGTEAVHEPGVFLPSPPRPVDVGRWIAAGEIEAEPKHENGRHDDGGVGDRYRSQAAKPAHQTLQRTTPPASRTGREELSSGATRRSLSTAPFLVQIRPTLCLVNGFLRDRPGQHQPPDGEVCHEMPVADRPPLPRPNKGAPSLQLRPRCPFQ